MKKYISSIGGFLAGCLSGLLGAGGGMIVVPMLSKSGLDTKKAHANSVVIILPICIVSAVIYIVNGKVHFSDAMPYLLWGVIGSVLGAFILTKIKAVWLKRIFGVLLIWAAIRMLLN